MEEQVATMMTSSVVDLATRLDALESRVYQTLRGITEECETIAAEADQQGNPAFALRAQLMVTDVRSRSGDPAGALTAQLLLRQAAQPWPVLVRRAAMLLATSCDRLGERTELSRWIRAALADWPEDDHPTWRAEALMVFALHAVSHKGVDYTLVRHAVTEVKAHCSPLLLSVTLANFAEVSAECGDLVIATEFADSSVALLHRHPEIAAPLTLDSIARARLAGGEIAAAERSLGVALQLERELGCSDVGGDPWLTLAELRLATGDPAGAWAMLEDDRRLAWAAKTSWQLSRDLKLRAGVLAALGRWQEAYGALTTHIDVYETIRSLDSDRAVAENETLQAVDEERRRARQFEQLALTDPLTGLPNRRQATLWLSRAEEATANEPGANQIAVAIVDLDHFKRINDTYSHDIGDLVLRGVATTLLESCRPGGDARPALVARLGGEEFVIVWQSVSADEATADAVRILARVRGTEFVEAGSQIRVTASIGLAHGVPSGAGSNLLKAADICLYKAKDLGRDRCVSIEGVAA